MKMSKKFVSTVLIGALTLSMSITGFSEDFVQADDADDTIELMEYLERPELDLIESLDTNTYVGAYWEGEVQHIIPVAEYAEELTKQLQMAAFADTIGLPTIVVDDVPVRAYSDTPVYSMADRENGHAFLVDNREELNIQAVGFTADELAVFMNEGATEADRQAVLAASPVKAIEFHEPFVTMESDVAGQDSELDIGIQPAASSVDLRGGNSIRREPNKIWSSATVSAAYNGQSGILTCGHGYTNGQTVYARDGSAIGTANVHVYNNMDVTFVRLNNASLSPRGYMNDGTQFNRYGRVGTADVNKTIKKYGSRLGNETGIIKAVGISGGWNGYSYTGCYMVSTRTQGGDSGGPIIYNVNGYNALIGLIIGAKTSSQWSGDPKDPIYHESAIFPIMNVVEGPGFMPSI